MKILDKNIKNELGANIKNYPREVRYLLLRNCNYKCIYCHSERAKEKNVEIPYELLKKEIENNKENIDIIHLTGGEPLLYSSFDKLIEFINKKNFKSHLTTNGSLIHKKTRQLQKVTEVHVSLPTLDDKKYKLITKTNNLNRVLDNLNFKKIHFEINFLPIKSFNNIAELPNYIKLCEEKGIKSINILEMESRSQDLVSYNKVRALLNKNFGPIKEETILRHNHPVDRITINGVNIHLCDIAMFQDNVCSNCKFFRTCNEGIYHPRLFYNNKIIYQTCGFVKKFENYSSMELDYAGNFFYKRRI
ncbi:MAG: radical SAM protein [Sphaerochaetaceae bacterium]|nr:radical SAM protein [Sphaerochaetaceae bacterium]